MDELKQGGFLAANAGTLASVICHRFHRYFGKWAVFLAYF